MPSPVTDQRPRRAPLELLARLHGLQLDYWDVFGQRRRPSDEAVLAVLRARGAPVAGPDEVGDALRQRLAQLWRRPLEPVSLAAGGGGTLVLRLPEELRHRPARLRLELEDGASETRQLSLARAPVRRRRRVDGQDVVTLELALPPALPHGYHRALVEVGDKSWESHLIAFPRRAPDHGALGRHRGWGVFAPLYGVRSEGDWGAGDFSLLERLGEWTAGHGGTSLSTLPLLAVEPDPPGGASPYSPLSRAFWSEIYVDPARTPELGECPAARATLGSASLARETAAARRRHLVDYPGLAARKRRVLEQLAAVAYGPDGRGSDGLRAYLARRPEADLYARFRAARERHGRPWASWPSRPRDGELEPDDYAEAARRYHLYAQWKADEQIRAAARSLDERDVTLYLDLPLGTPEDSYDVWRHRHQYALGATTGAPPDTFFMGGQNWAFPPLDPERSREQGHKVVRAALRHHMSVAGTLRIDHVMGLHRLYWIPDGFPATDGVYVRYPARELWAVVALEARRSDTIVVGEDLGTVPDSVRRSMARRGAHRIYVVQTAVRPDRVPGLLDPVAHAVACVNTHDMPTFQGFWNHADLHDLAALGHLDADAADAENARRAASKAALLGFLRHGGWLDEDEDDAGAVLQACLRYLADGPAAEVVVTLEDLWLEERPQNVPGTSSERPNWQRRLRHGLEELDGVPGLAALLADLSHRRPPPAAHGKEGDDDR